jgi:hypothetical protein
MSDDAHAHTTIDDIEEHYEEKDDSRPFFQRQKCKQTSKKTGGFSYSK